MFFINVVGNIVVFIPVGMFLPALFKRCKNVILTMLVSLELSLFAEVVQLATRVGSFDVDDLLLNTLGGLCGYLVCWIFQKHKAKKAAK